MFVCLFEKHPEEAMFGVFPTRPDAGKRELCLVHSFDSSLGELNFLDLLYVRVNERQKGNTVNQHNGPKENHVDHILIAFGTFFFFSFPFYDFFVFLVFSLFSR